MRRITLYFVLAAILLLSACAGLEGASGATSPQSAADDAAKGWRKLSYEGVSIAYPPEWEALEVPGGKVVAEPEKAAYIHLRLAAGEGSRIAQTDEATVKQQYEASLTYEEANVEAFAKKEIGGEEAIMAVLTATKDEIGSDPVTELIYYALIRRGENAVTVICTCREEKRGELEDTFQKVVDSITVG